MFDIHGIMKELAKRRPVFHSEADFQFALAWRQRTIPKSEMRLSTIHVPTHNIEDTVDIYSQVRKDVIELKYPTL